MHMMLTRLIPAAVDLDPWWLSWPGACLGRPGHLGVLAAVAKMAGTCMSRARPYGRAKIRVNGRWYQTFHWRFIDFKTWVWDWFCQASALAAGRPSISRPYGTMAPCLETTVCVPIVSASRTNACRGPV